VNFEARLSRLALPDVALCAVTSVAVPETMRAMRRCLEQVEFGSTVLLTDETGLSVPASIELRQIEAIRSHPDYSEFILRRLADHVDRQHVLVVQWDGFVIDAAKWTDEFLEYDYIGAPWPQFTDGRTVGNGGFSLRSRRLLELTASAAFPGSHPEDVSIGRTYRDWLERQGIRFAPPAVAERFAFERGPQTASFGFHGLFNFPLVLSETDLESTLAELDPQLLSGRDGADLMLELARRRDLRWAWNLALRARKTWLPGNLRLWTRLIAATFARGRSRRAADEI
jgi:Protein of unknown function (DUF5672)